MKGDRCQSTSSMPLPLLFGGNEGAVAVQVYWTELLYEMQLRSLAATESRTYGGRESDSHKSKD